MRFARGDRAGGFIARLAPLLVAVSSGVGFQVGGIRLVFGLLVVILHH